MKDIQIRHSTILDVDILLEWRNHRSTRKASHNSSVVTRRDHNNWFNNILNDSMRTLYIAEMGGTPVGTIRADKIDNRVKLSWTISPDSRNKGIAKQIVFTLVKKTNEAVFAEIKKNNIASIRVAEYAGLAYQSQLNGIACYGRDAL